MKKEQILSALKKAKEGKKRNFSQTYDLVINLRDINLKKPEEKIDTFMVLPHSRGKEVKICALVDKDLSQEAKKCDHHILKDDFVAYNKKPKEIKKLAKQYDFFIAQANIMPDIAKTFGKILGQRGKMPNPKSGCIVPPKINLQPIITKLKKTVRLITKNELIVRAAVGKDSLKEEELVDNIEAIYSTVVRALHDDEKKVKSVLLKLTMGKPIYLMGEPEVKENKKIEEKPKEEIKIVKKKKVTKKKAVKKVEEKKDE